MSKSPAEFIKEKGVANIAIALNMRAGTVRMWKLRNRLPRAVWPDLARAFPDLDMDTLLEIEARAA